MTQELQDDPKGNQHECFPCGVVGIMAYLFCVLGCIVGRSCGMITVVEKDGLIVGIIEDTLSGYVGLLLDSEKRSSIYCEPDVKGEKEITYRGSVVRKGARS